VKLILISLVIVREQGRSVVTQRMNTPSEFTASHFGHVSIIIIIIIIISDNQAYLQVADDEGGGRQPEGLVQVTLIQTIEAFNTAAGSTLMITTMTNISFNSMRPEEQYETREEQYETREEQYETRGTV